RLAGPRRRGYDHHLLLDLGAKTNEGLGFVIETRRIEQPDCQDDRGNAAGDDKSLGKFSTALNWLELW
uniref:hypothetical protein n=1 Tax=Serratia marcescens TaxID=615 RepID=UPI0019538396